MWPLRHGEGEDGADGGVQADVLFVVSRSAELTQPTPNQLDAFSLSQSVDERNHHLPRSKRFENSPLT